MSAPMKPWEGVAMNSAPVMPSNLSSSALAGGPPRVMASTSTTAPPVPPRLNPRIASNLTTATSPQSSYYPNTGITGAGYMSSPYTSMYGAGMGYGGYGTSYGSYGGYNSYGGGGYGGYGTMGGYSGYGVSPYGGGPMGAPGAENRFIQLAEESSRPTFQMIESVIRTFGSMATMLDQTFFAMTSSFRAILSVADSFGRLRSMFARIWTSFALFRAINWLVRRILSLIGLRRTVNSMEVNSAWRDAITETADSAGAGVSKWPIAIFLGVICSAPYIISRIFGETLAAAKAEDEQMAFRKIKTTYDFTARQSHELSFAAGETLSIYPDDVQQRQGLSRSGWVLAKNVQGQSGAVPVSYLQRVLRAPDVQVPQNKSTAAKDLSIENQEPECATISKPPEGAI